MNCFADLAELQRPHHVVCLKQQIMKTTHTYKQSVEREHENMFRDLLELQNRLKSEVTKAHSFEQEIFLIIQSIDALFERALKE